MNFWDEDDNNQQYPHRPEDVFWAWVAFFAKAWIAFMILRGLDRWWHKSPKGKLIGFVRLVVLGGAAYGILYWIGTWSFFTSM